MDNDIRKLCSETEKLSRTSTSVELLIANGSFVLPSAISCDFSQVFRVEAKEVIHNFSLADNCGKIFLVVFL